MTFTSRFMRYYYDQNDAVTSDFEVTDIYYREDNNFLEGFYYDSQRESFYESTGLTGKSYVHKLSYNPSTWTLSIDTEKQSKLNKRYFGEGLAPRSAT